jgi:hypothetical protein
MNARRVRAIVSPRVDAKTLESNNGERRGRTSHRVVRQVSAALEGRKYLYVNRSRAGESLRAPLLCLPIRAALFSYYLLSAVLLRLVSYVLVHHQHSHECLHPNDPALTSAPFLTPFLMPFAELGGGNNAGRRANGICSLLPSEQMPPRMSSTPLPSLFRVLKESCRELLLYPYFSLFHITTPPSRSPL